MFQAWRPTAPSLSRLLWDRRTHRPIMSKAHERRNPMKFPTRLSFQACVPMPFQCSCSPWLSYMPGRAAGKCSHGLGTEPLPSQLHQNPGRSIIGWIVTVMEWITSLSFAVTMTRFPSRFKVPVKVYENRRVLSCQAWLPRRNGTAVVSKIANRQYSLTVAWYQTASRSLRWCQRVPDMKHAST